MNRPPAALSTTRRSAGRRPPGRGALRAWPVLLAVGVGLVLGACSPAAGEPGSAPSPTPSTSVGTAPEPSPTPVATGTGEPDPTEPPDEPVLPPFPVLAASTTPSTYTPSLDVALDDEPDPYLDGCHQLRVEAALEPCVYGDPDGAVRVALVGDSHAAQWLGAVRAVAERHGWRLETYTKSACPWATAEVWIRKDDMPYATCAEWNQKLQAHLVASPPDVVVTSMSGEYDGVVEGRKIPAGSEADAMIAAGVAEAWRGALDAGADVVVLADTPWYPLEVVPCLQETPGDAARCDAPREPSLALSAAPILGAALAAEPRAHHVDLLGAVCGPQVCPAVVDGMIVMRDEHHFTGTFSRSLSPWLEPALTWVIDR